MPMPSAAKTTERTPFLTFSLSGGEYAIVGAPRAGDHRARRGHARAVDAGVPARRHQPARQRRPGRRPRAQVPHARKSGHEADLHHHRRGRCRGRADRARRSRRRRQPGRRVPGRGDRAAALLRHAGARGLPARPRQARRRIRPDPRHRPRPVGGRARGRRVGAGGGAPPRSAGAAPPPPRRREAGHDAARSAARPSPRSTRSSAFARSASREFALFQALILRESGIYLAPAKKALLVGRLSKRLRALGLTTFDAYYRRIVDEDDREERVEMLDCVSTNETHFFREPRQFEFLERQVVPRWRERGSPACCGSGARDARPARSRTRSRCCCSTISRRTRAGRSRSSPPTSRRGRSRAPRRASGRSTRPPRSRSRTGARSCSAARRPRRGR